MWEEYLDQAVQPIVNKYQARRLKAKIRSRLLLLREQYMVDAIDSQTALLKAMETLGSPEWLAERFAEPECRERGWLWLISIMQLGFGVGIMVVSTSTESLAALALGRVVTLLAVFSTGIHTVNQNGLRKNLWLMRMRWNLSLSRTTWGTWSRITTIGILSGALAAVLGSVPWMIVTTNMTHPIAMSETLGIVIAVFSMWAPWIIFRNFTGLAFFSVTWQLWASFSATLFYSLLVTWHAGFIPPPLFNWQPVLFMSGTWVFYFASLRVLAFVLGTLQRIDPWSDDELSRAV